MASDAPKKLPASGLCISLLIDADNASAEHIGQVIKWLQGRGSVTIRRAYGNWKKPTLSSWEKILHTHAIEPIQLFDLSKGKNATDIRLVIDAMDLLASREVDAFAILSSDCDFTPLSIRLREAGKSVFGFGKAKTPKPFVQSCTEFLSLDGNKKSVKSATHHQPPVKALSAKLIASLQSAVKAAADDEGWAPLGQVGNQLRAPGPFNQKEYGFSTLKKLLSAIDSFEFNELIVGEKRTPRVRLKVKSETTS